MQFRGLQLIWLFAAGMVLVACQSNSDNLQFVTITPDSVYQPPVGVSGLAGPWADTRIEMDDGAALVIPSDSVSGPTTATIERNPAKLRDLPPLDADVIPLGDFYDFQIEGGGRIVPVEIALPYDETRIPAGTGMLVMAVPTENGWQYVPVDQRSNPVWLYLPDAGDPVIAWHLIPDFERQTYTVARAATNQQLREEARYACDPKISLAALAWGRTLIMMGRLAPPSERFFDVILDYRPSRNVMVSFAAYNTTIMRGPPEVSGQVFTDEEGRFYTEIALPDYVPGGHYVVNAIADCEPWWGRVAVRSVGVTSFELWTPPAPAAETPLDAIESLFTITPTSTPILDGAAPVPSVTGMPLNVALKTLQDAGYGTTWLDGPSDLAPGLVYRQLPAAGSITVPRRTTIVLYRSTEQVVNTPTPSLSTRLPVPTHTPEPTPTVWFYVDNVWITRGNCTTLRWDVTNSGWVSLNKQTVNPSDTMTVCPSQTTVYDLEVAWDEWVTRTWTITVEVRAGSAGSTPLPPPAPTTGGAGTLPPAIAPTVTLYDILKATTSNPQFVAYSRVTCAQAEAIYRNHDKAAYADVNGRRVFWVAVANNGQYPPSQSQYVGIIADDAEQVCPNFPY